MRKDFAASYEQHRWQFFANQHARACAALANAHFPAMIAWHTKRKLEAEEAYPQLAERNTNERTS